MSLIPVFPDSMPDPHRRFLSSLIGLLRRDARIVGIASGGSFITNLMDKFGDLDLIIAVDPLHYANVTGDRNGIAGSLGPLLAPITGEHVGELLHF